MIREHMEEKKKEEINTLLEKIKNINIREVEEKKEDERKEKRERAGQEEAERKEKEQEENAKEPKEKTEKKNDETVKNRNTKEIKKEKRNLVITERDREILAEISRWKCILGRQIRIIGGFDGQRSCDRRMSKLIDNEYLERKRYIYGISGIYSIKPKAKKQFNINLPISQVRLDQIEHDIAVIDTAIYFIKKKGINKTDIVSEKQIRNEQGFTTRTHLPDFIFNQDGKKYCVEVELSLKAKDRLEKNIKQNYMNYEVQNWIVPSSKVKIKEILQNNTNKYPNIEIIELEEIQSFTKSLDSKE